MAETVWVLDKVRGGRVVTKFVGRLGYRRLSACGGMDCYTQLCAENYRRTSISFIRPKL